ncbi:MAG: hypothetical protein ACXWGV_10440 [Solirubrobacterales bacterium]
MTTKRKSNGTLGLALLAALTLVIGGVAGPVASAAGGESTATVAKKKKKCKKKGKKAESAKKKGCKKKKKGQKPAQLVRATLTWDTEAPDFDLWVFDQSGNRARAGSNPIANTAFSADDTEGLGPETFTDLRFTKPGRAFSYGVCFQDGGSNPTTFTLVYVTADGVSHTASDTIGSDGGYRTYDGGAPTPDNFCKAQK